MIGPTASNCPNCGAPLPQPVAGVWNCAFCGRSGTLSTLARQASQPRPTASHSGGGRAVALGTTIALIGFGVAATFFSRGGAVSVKHTTEVSVGVKPQNATSDSKQPNFLWDDVGGPPIITRVDNKEAVFGRIRTVSDGDQLYALLTDSATLTERYRLGPFGTYSEGYRNTHFAVTNGVVIASDFRSQLHFYDLKTGKESASLALSDRVECLSVAGDNQVRIEQVDGKSLRLDPVSRTTTATPKRPRNRGGDPCSKRRSVERLELSPTKAPEVDGFAALRVFIDGDVGIAAGKKSPGTPVPWVVGFETKTNRVLWRQLLPNVDPNTVGGSSALAGALAHQRYVSVYPVGSENHRLTAFDASNGARLWDVELRAIFAVDRIEDIVLSEAFVYAVRTSSLDVLDAKTGRLIGAIGRDTYDK
jgi:outer membrane protein assembly factor BamB